MNDVSILGLGVSGHAAALLALKQGAEVYVSDSKADASTATRGTELRALGARVDLGGHDADRIARSDTVVVSPGIPPRAPVLLELRERGVRWISEPEFAFRFFRGALIAVTGTNGKTTTCALTAHLLEEGGLSVGLGGNIGAGLGPAASELALREPAPAWYVVEVSSFQLADIETFKPDIGVLTNLASDHLDRYADVEAYHADKARLFENADAESRWVLNADDPAVLELAGDAAGHRTFFATGRTDVEGGVVDDGVLTLRTAGETEALLPRDELPLLGEHNVANCLAAAVTAHLAGVEAQDLARGLRTARPLPHRLQPVLESGGVLWIDDSKATNVVAAASAVRSVVRPVVWLLGGTDKGEELAPLARVLDESRVRTVLAYGAAAERIAGSLEGRVELRRLGSDFEEVVEAAASEARPGDAVLLAPACSSFDMFRDYEERGRRFTELARALARRAGRGEGR